MTRRIIVVGDGGSHAGARVISGSPHDTIEGRAVARKGDLVDCPQRYPGGKPHGINRIVEGSLNDLLDGVPLALEGHRTECGCVLVGSVPDAVL
ncbi:MAG: PAAR domain-containing protein [Burkholderiaceae bacterium]|nr:PAAR domain-containing protein [Burkholderiaceae bacterium]